MTMNLSTSTYDEWSALDKVFLMQRLWSENIEYAVPTSNLFSDFVRLFSKHNQLNMQDLYVIVAWTVFFTIFRYVAVAVLIPLATWLKFKSKDRLKFSECSSKFISYTSMFMYEYYLINYKYPTYRYVPGSHWTDHAFDMEVPADIKLIYLAQAGFYFYAIYATVCLDIWRKDSLPMLFHHFLANALIIFSLSLRYHRIGLAVLYLHDVADVFLEGTKICTCFNNREKTPFWDTMCTLGFLGFAWIWFFFRLYVFPNLVVFGAGYVGPRLVGAHDHFFFMFNVWLMILLFLNIYWFHFILKFIYKAVVGDMDTVEDIREEDEDRLGGESGEESPRGVEKSPETTLNGHVKKEAVDEEKKER